MVGIVLQNPTTAGWEKVGLECWINPNYGHFVGIPSLNHHLGWPRLRSLHFAQNNTCWENDWEISETAICKIGRFEMSLWIWLGFLFGPPIDIWYSKGNKIASHPWPEATSCRQRCSWRWLLCRCFWWRRCWHLGWCRLCCFGWCCWHLFWCLWWWCQWYLCRCFLKGWCWCCWHLFWCLWWWCHWYLCRCFLKGWCWCCWHLFWCLWWWCHWYLCRCFLKGWCWCCWHLFWCLWWWCHWYLCRCFLKRWGWCCWHLFWCLWWWCHWYLCRCFLKGWCWCYWHLCRCPLCRCCGSSRFCHRCLVSPQLNASGETQDCKPHINHWKITES